MSAVCATCEHWSATLPSLANAARRPAGADEQIGVCQLYPPTIVRAAGLWCSLFPEVHATRTCGDWSPPLPSDEDGPDGGEEVDGNVLPFGRAAA